MTNVLLYSTPTCPYCDRAKAFLKKHSINFTEFDVYKQAEKGKEMVEKSKQMSVPVIDIDGKILIGFNERKLREALGLPLEYD